MKKTAAMLSVLFAAAIFLAACGGTELKQPGSSRSPDTLRLVGDDPNTLDPALVTDAGSAFFVEEIFGGLLGLAPKNKAPQDALCYQDVCLIADIAEKIPEPALNSDGTASYVFKIRPNVYFHSGRQARAEDVKYSLERAADPRTGSSTAELYLSDIVGVMDKYRGRANEVKGVKVISEFSLEITTDALKPHFLWKLSYPTAFVVDKNQVTSNPRGWQETPNGTGPFRLTEFERGYKIVLEANERYHLGVAAIKRLHFNLAAGSVLTMYENNEVDVSGIGLADIERVRDPRGSLNREFIESSSMDTFYIGFNVKQAPFDDVKLRQALALAIDKETLVRVVLKDVATAAYTVLPPGMPGYREDYKPIIYNLARAKQLLSESGYWPNVPRITLWVPGSGATAGGAIEAIVAMWKDGLGLDVEIKQVEFGSFMQDLKRQRYGAFTMGWIADYPDPEDFLDLKFYSAKSPANNESRYANYAVDSLLDQARIEQDAAKRVTLYQKAEDIILAEVPWIPLYHSKHIYVVKPYVRNFMVSSMVVPFLRFVELR
ncbi:MAG: hypothetical protein A2667_02630 [Candidatus Wildermuthbacteria bacterium RIFCSPHIGHO2_01_FULL_47_27]|uniref:Solute-binding protein family 5 domain-containing protein n=2 Tax=Candidatus Wildermuthiibacteriota TaxID=1817923 RepID=A0A1G2RLN1_9BACT|nr:MAG: hypothetical protein A2667_02630 [Candidatus Wildermuthbacteria bacterium RIFCSPHIGHO2_01_FULL_47_27]OHA68301.1 MAG: hypothetical protein A3D59_04035 [Candidatus Wildermuthbacteria bacterium RIFCSPHIGHO2_02_FULL_47_17]OHA73754.1 MAG: hypothetical protein A3A32_01375 [Candidatus Wildermuthbacteria bacterium RIFCSPLOWO2_01_FULL_48_35]OHA76003.1 MAG: hypothetical protein A3I38_03170 [Candidatus Wildermuthbacteria bacterium RIFCSPLOWO2_02_FULL_47_10]